MKIQLLLIIFILCSTHYLEANARLKTLPGNSFKGYLKSIRQTDKLLILKISDSHQDFFLKIDKNLENILNFIILKNRIFQITTLYRPDGPIIQFSVNHGSSKYIIGLNYKKNITLFENWKIYIGSCLKYFRDYCNSKLIINTTNKKHVIPNYHSIELPNIKVKEKIYFFNIKKYIYLDSTSNDFPKFTYSYIYIKSLVSQ